MGFTSRFSIFFMFSALRAPIDAPLLALERCDLVREFACQVDIDVLNPLRDPSSEIIFKHLCHAFPFL